MDEFESFFSSLIPPPEQDLWLMAPQEYSLNWSQQPPSLNNSGNQLANQQGQQQQQPQQQGQQGQQQGDAKQAPLSISQQMLLRQHLLQQQLHNPPTQTQTPTSQQSTQQQNINNNNNLNVNSNVDLNTQLQQLQQTHQIEPHHIEALQKQHQQFVQHQQEFLLQQQIQLQQLEEKQRQQQQQQQQQSPLSSPLQPSPLMQQLHQQMPPISADNLVSSSPEQQQLQQLSPQQIYCQQTQQPNLQTQSFSPNLTPTINNQPVNFQLLQQQQQQQLPTSIINNLPTCAQSKKTKKKGKQQENDQLHQQQSNFYNNNFNLNNFQNFDPTSEPVIVSKLEDFDDESKGANRVNQNLASRNYRQRRKDYIKEIEAKLAALTFENHQLKRENESLKESGGVEVMRPEPELIAMLMEGKQIIIQMSQAIKKNDERTLVYLLHLFHSAIAKRYAIAEREVEKIVHPYTQSKLASMGYVPKSDRPVLSISGPASDGWFYLYKKEANLTEEQSQKLEALRVEHDKIETALRIEREQLDKEIKRFFYTKILVLPNNPEAGELCGVITAGAPICINSEYAIGGQTAVTTSSEDGTPPVNTPLEIGQILDFARKLDSLKKNFIRQRNQSVDTISSLSSILTPRQEAMLLVRVHFNTTYDFAHMELLKDVWTNIVNQNKSTGPKNIAEALARFSASESANVMPTVEQIVKPPQFHQYNPKQVKKERSNSYDRKKKKPSTPSTSNSSSSSICNSTPNIGIINMSDSSSSSSNTSNTTINTNKLVSNSEPTTDSTSFNSEPMVLPPPPPEAIPYPSSSDKKYHWYVYPGNQQ